jgi:exoribonuclease R
MASKAFLRKLRKKYRLGEFRVRAKKSKTTLAKLKKFAKRYGGTIVYPPKKPGKRATPRVRGKSRTPILTKYKRRARKAARKGLRRLGKGLGIGLNKLGNLQGFEDR